MEPSQKEHQMVEQDQRMYGGASAADFSWLSKTSNVEVYIVDKVTVKVYCADILEVPVDCIVNAANAQLQHHGGVAKSIAKAAVLKLKKESEDIIQRLGLLQVGEACSTTAGDLPYRYVIHTVGPCWSWYTPHDLAQVKKCEWDLEMAIRNSMSKAEELGQSSIAIPAVSAGQFGCPEEFCAIQYARAVLAYSLTSRKPIQEVHFVDKNDAMVKEMHRVFNKVAKKGDIPKGYDIHKFVMGLASSTHMPANNKGNAAGIRSNKPVSTGSLDDRRSGTNPASYNSQYPYCLPEKTLPAAGQIFTCFLSQNQKLLVYTGNILFLDNIDMIACGENVKGNSDGFIAQQLFLNGRKSYQDAKKNDFKFGSKKGELVVSFTGENRFKYVAHAILYMKTDTKDKEDRRQKMKNIFGKIWKAMVDKNCQTLALPLLGTGKRKADPEYFTQILFESLRDFCSNPANKSKTIQIHLVNNKKEKTDTAVRAIQEEARAMKTMPAAHRQAAARPTSAAPGGNRDKKARQDNSRVHRTTAHGRHGNKFSAREGFESDSDEEDKGGFSSSRHGKDIDNSAESESTMAAAARSQTSDRVPKKRNLTVFDDDKDDTGPVEDVEEGISNMSLSKKDKNTKEADRERESSRPSTFEAADGDDCVICMDTMKQPKTLPCGHKFCTGCIEAQFQYKEVCPTCGKVCGMITGDQPEGKMEEYVSPHSHCAGYENCGRIQITYSFSNGNQQSHHPNPGKFYKGIRMSGYLPNNKRGREVLEMLKVAFERKLVFTIGNSRTTGQQGVITWNDIHHKTDPQPNTPFGYPDPTYLDRVVDELKANGVTTADIPRGSFSRSTRL